MIGLQEGLGLEQQAAELLVESVGNDIRQVLNCLQMWNGGEKPNGQTATYMDVKERLWQVNKDSILRLSPFDAATRILEARDPLSAR